MTRIRILLVGLPPLLRDILGESLGGDSDMEVVGSTDGGAELPAVVQQLTPHLVVLGPGGHDESDAMQEARRVMPSLLILSISGRGEDAVFHGPDQHRLAMRDVSPTALKMAIRDYVAPTAERALHTPDRR